jgi:hypothetical protein
MKVQIFLLLIFIHSLSAQPFPVDPEKSVFLELNNGEKLFGRVIDADSQQLHLVGAKVNRLIPFTQLTEASKKQFHLPPTEQEKAAPVAEFHGLNSTRLQLQKSQELLSTQLRVQHFHESILPTWRYRFYPALSLNPWLCPKQHSIFNSHFQISY